MIDIAPPHSYIDIKDFPSFKGFTLLFITNIKNLDKYLELAKYIVRVSEDDALFASFFWWEKFYRVQKCETELEGDILLQVHTSENKFYQIRFL